MKHRIRAAAIIVENDKILLVKHVHPKTKDEWWVPPGGGMEESDLNIYQCAVRETWEETGYNIKTTDIMYIREFKDDELKNLNIEIFIKANIENGSLTIDNIYGKGLDEEYIKDAKWLGKNEIENLVVFPEIIKTNEFWSNIKDSEVGTKYLGRK